MNKLKPFNIELLFPTNDVVRGLRPTTVTDIYQGVSSNFNDDGLFSTVTYGRQGSNERDTTFSYIKLNAEIIHPAIFEVIRKLKRLYIDILSGKGYAVWNPKLKDFEASDMFRGETGYSFFIRHIRELNPERNNSKKRNLYLDVFKKYQKDPTLYNSLVLPAGLRDLYVEANGQETQDEINDLYRKLITIANNINLVGSRREDSTVDTQRWNLQCTMNAIYDYLKNMLEGKKGVVQAKWGGRKIINGTRNVLTSMEMLASNLEEPDKVSVNTVQVSLLETMIGALPITIHALKKKFLDNVFIDPRKPSSLINRDTLEREDVFISTKNYDNWAVAKKLEKKVAGFSDDRLRNKPVIIEGYYLDLVWMSKDRKQFRIIHDIRELNDNQSPEDVHPITYGEMFYLCNYAGWYTLKGNVTRYPIAGIYSIFPANVYVRTTLDGFQSTEIDEAGNIIGIAKEYPNYTNKSDNTWFNTMAVNSCKLGVLAGDHDGDVTSLNIPYSKEAIAEIERNLNSISNIVDAQGNFIFSSNTDIPKRVIQSFTGEPLI